MDISKQLEVMNLKMARLEQSYIEMETAVVLMENFIAEKDLQKEFDSFVKQSFKELFEKGLAKIN